MRPIDKFVARRPAARGLVVLLPDLHAACFIETFPIAHKAETEADHRPRRSPAGRIGIARASSIVGLARGDYTLEDAMTHGRQNRHIGYYRH